MGTRGITGVVIDGVEKFQYQQYDSYPGGVGVTVLGQLRQELTNEAVLYTLARELKIHNEGDPITEAEAKAMAKYTDTGVGHVMKDDGSIDDSLNWYQLTRKTQGDLSAMLLAGHIIDSADFPREDSLFCEWAWVVDLDERKFEAYQGFQGTAPTEGRFKDAPENTNHNGDPSGYYPCALVGSWSFDALPSDQEFSDWAEVVEGA